MSENEIKCKILTCKKYGEKDLFFHTISGAESDKKKSGISSFCDLLSENYGTLGKNLLNSPQHEKVIEIIEEIKKKQPKKLTVGEIVEISKIEKQIFQENQLEMVQNGIEKILKDFNEIGYLTYLPFQSTKKILIADPNYLDLLFRKLLDYGRIRVQLKLEKINHFFESIKDYKHSKNKQNARDSLYKEIEILKYNANKELDFHQIWESKEEKRKSLIDKIEYQDLIEKLDLFEKKLVEEKNEKTEEILNQLRENKSSISQSIFSFDVESVVDVLIDILGVFCNDKKKRETLLFLLFRSKIFIPENKTEIFEGLIRKQNFYVPFLFPKQKSIFFDVLHFEKTLKMKNFYQFKIEYQIPLFASPLLRILFPLIKKKSFSNRKKYKFHEENYHFDGFLFIFTNLKYNSDTLILFQIHSENQNNTKQLEHNTFIQMKIKSHSSPQKMFDQIDQTIKSFLEDFFGHSHLQPVKTIIKKKRIEIEELLQTEKEREEKNCIFCKKVIHNIEKDCQFCSSKNFLSQNELFFVKWLKEGESTFIFLKKKILKSKNFYFS